jgi:hypothetical protein
MSEITPKPPELLQSQIATFAAEIVEQYQDKAHLFNNLGNLAITGVEDITRTTNTGEYHTDENGKSVRVPEGAKRLITTGDAYTDFLRSVGGSKYEAIQGRADILKTYSSFAPAINRLKTELADPATRKEHPSYLGNGSNSTVFKITKEGKDYAIRVPNSKDINPGVIDSHLAGAILGKGVPHLEQIVAASYEDGVTVAEKMPGKEIGDLSITDIVQITDRQLSELVDTLVSVHERGIEIDPKPSNIFYDPELGFGIVDYHSSKVAGKNSADQELGTIVGWMATDINNAGFYGKPYNPAKDVEDYARDVEFCRANLDVLNRYRTVVEQKLTGENCDKALQEIDSKVQSTQESIESYSNPEWVTERVAQNKESQRQRAERANKPKPSVPDGWGTIPLYTV